MLVSPAEPVPLRELGITSSITERYGSDFIILSPVFGRVGIQRKEVSDLVNSLHDGRVEREIWQMRGLDQGVWLIEGTMQWTNDQRLLSSPRRSYSKAMHLGVVLSLQSNGYWVLNSTSLTDSIDLLSSLNRWLAKSRHTSLLARPSLKDSLGGKGDKTDRQIHIMQGFEGVGYEKARRIVEGAGGLPFQMKDGVELRDIRGIGEKLATRIEGTL